MDAEKIKAALDAIKAGDADAALALLEEMITAAIAGDEAPAPEGDALADAPAEEVDEESKLAKMLTAKLSKLTGRKEVGEIIAAVESWDSRIKTIEDREAAIELSQRRELIGDLIALKVETPADAWAGEAKDRTPVARLMVEPVADMRARVERLKASAPKGVKPPKTAPVTALGAVTYDLTTLKRIKDLGLTVEQFEARKLTAVRRAGVES